MAERYEDPQLAGLFHINGFNQNCLFNDNMYIQAKHLREVESRNQSLRDLD